MKWRLSPRFPSYEVSEDGAVRRVAAGIRGGFIGKVMKPYRRADGYNMYILRRDNRSYHVKAHRLVAEAFISPRPFEGAEVCHNDGTRHNDHFTNLRWDTRAGNHADKVLHGTAPRGENQGSSKLTAEQVAEIKAAYANGELQRIIADKYSVQQSQVSRIVNGVRWSYL